MATLELGPVNEVINARLALQGGVRGAPKKINDTTYEGAALNQAALVVLAAALEAYVEDVFRECVDKRYSDYGQDAKNKLLRQLPRARTTDVNQIIGAFLVLGNPDVFEGMSWQKCPTATVRKKLGEINQLRNRAAHGQPLSINGKPRRLTTKIVWGYREFANRFGERFSDHAVESLES